MSNSRSSSDGRAKPIIEFGALRCPGQDAALSFALRPGLSFISGGEGRGKSSLLRLIADAARARGLSVWLEQPADAAHDQTVARAWLDERRHAAHPAWNDALQAALVQALALDEHLDKPMYMLSAGSRRKLGLAGAAASGAAVTLLDVPFAAIDMRSARVLGELLADAAADEARAWVLADYALPAALEDAALAGEIALGD
jgi:ABC-type transport system involved in cytochrome c biogenesis ATPase subunit